MSAPPYLSPSMSSTTFCPRPLSICIMLVFLFENFHSYAFSPEPVTTFLIVPVFFIQCYFDFRQNYILLSVLVKTGAFGYVFVAANGTRG